MDSEGENFDGDVDSDCNSTYPEDYESEYSPASAGDDFGMPDPRPHLHTWINPQLTELDADTEFLHNQENVHDPVSGDGGSEHTEIANCKDQESE